MKRKLFGENLGTGVAGVSLLSYGLDVRRSKADPLAVLSVIQPPKRMRKLTLYRPPLPTVK